jgi:hypothetical protein
MPYRLEGWGKSIVLCLFLVATTTLELTITESQILSFTLTMIASAKLEEEKQMHVQLDIEALGVFDGVEIPLKCRLGLGLLRNTNLPTALHASDNLTLQQTAPAIRSIASITVVYNHLQQPTLT